MQAHRQNGTDIWPLVLISLGVILGLQSIRALFPLVIFHPEFHLPVSDSAIMGVLLIGTFLMPFLTPIVVSLLGIKRTVWLTLGGLAAARLLIQFAPTSDVMLVLAILSTAFVAIALPIGLCWTPDYRFVIGLILGLALDTALNSAVLTWDYVWRRDLLSLCIALILSGTLSYALWRQRTTLPATLYESSWRATLSAALLGPFFVLEMLFLHNSAFVASVTGLVLPWASGLVLLGDVLSLIAIGWIVRYAPGFLLKGVIGLALVVLLLGLNSLTATVGVILLAQPLISSLLLFALSRQSRAVEQTPLVKASVAVGLGSVLFIALVIFNYIDYTLRVSFSGTSIVLFATGVLLALATFKKLSPSNINLNFNRQWFVVPFILLLIPAGLLIARPGNLAFTPASPRFRLMTYNIHQGANIDGWVDLEAIAAAIEAQAPDVVVLQEAIRGQLVTGAADTVEWLSWRLRMPYRFAPATDNTFGEALLSRLPILGWQAGVLPKGNAVQQRSYILAKLELGTAEPVTVIGTHLDHTSSGARRLQVDQLLTIWKKGSRTIITGDMNAGPDAPEMRQFTSAGLISAQDVTGNDNRFTYDSRSPFVRIDWIFGSSDVTFSDFVIPQTMASDHLPLAVTVTLP